MAEGDFQANHLKLIEAPPPEKASRLVQLYTDVKAHYLDAPSCLYDARDSLAPAPVPPRPFPGPGNPASGRGPRLLRISIPNFSGRREDWKNFRDLFRSLIHEDSQVTNVERLFYLKSLAQGDANIALDTIQVAKANYSTAWALLEACYEHSHLLIHNHVTALRNIKPLRDKSAHGLQSLLDTLEKHRDQLRALGRPVAGWEDWFVSCGMTGMDPATRRAWEEEFQRLESTISGSQVDIATFATFTDFLWCRCHAASSVEASQPARPFSGTAARSSTSERNYHALATSNNTPSCHEGHYPGRCAQFQGLDVRARRELIYQARLCFNCLRPGHAVKYCPSRFSCQYCREQHHSSLHDGARRRRSRQPDGSTSSK
ncbi:uncharacterized protein LOC106641654 [Copidosoma floridanum]|uniref:uncharacterized protein LOC106641654 n=1 Tax=Copidosoma floridanum TaxID=29053 RepID=UPI0006C9DC9B|nr:uncharacterized protein LOC106641654 [Copidosoma floridanum]